MQLPHIDSEKAEELSKLSVTSVFDLIDMDDDMRIKALNLSTAKYAEVAAACNRYPNIEMEFELSENEVSAGDQVGEIHTSLANTFAIFLDMKWFVCLIWRKLIV